MNPNGRDKFHQIGDTNPSKGYIEVLLHGRIRRVREVSMEEHYFAYSFTKVFILNCSFVVPTLAPTYILHDVLSLKLSDGSSQQAEALQVQLKSKLNLQKISYVLTADSRQIHSCVKFSGFRDCSQS